MPASTYTLHTPRIRASPCPARAPPCWDRFLKDEDLGFIAEPHVSPAEELPAAHTCFMIVASDGLWDIITEERAAGLVIKVSREGGQGSFPACGPQHAVVHQLCAMQPSHVLLLLLLLLLQAFRDDPETTTAELIADLLLSQAISLRSPDDVTVMVVEKRPL